MSHIESLLPPVPNHLSCSCSYWGSRDYWSTEAATGVRRQLLEYGGSYWSTEAAAAVVGGSCFISLVSRFNDMYDWVRYVDSGGDTVTVTVVMQLSQVI